MRPEITQTLPQTYSVDGASVVFRDLVHVPCVNICITSWQRRLGTRNTRRYKITVSASIDPGIPAATSEMLVTYDLTQRSNSTTLLNLVMSADLIKKLHQLHL